MILLHRIGHTHEEVIVNADVLVMAEAHPDTVVTLATGARLVVAETPEEVSEKVREWRATVLAAGLQMDKLVAATG
jgi:flagellar protein FlbD